MIKKILKSISRKCLVFTRPSLLKDCQNKILNSYIPNSDYHLGYQKYYSQEYLYWKPVLGWIDELRNVNSVIDIGGAYGTLLMYASRATRAQDYALIDVIGYLSPALEKELNIKIYNLDIEKNELEINKKFDLIIFTEVIEHFNYHPLPALEKIKKLMHPQSVLLLTTPDASEWGRVTDYYSSLSSIPNYDGQQSSWIDGHIWQYEKNELDSLLLGAGFCIDRFDYSPGVSARHLCYQLRLNQG